MKLGGRSWLRARVMVLALIGIGIGASTVFFRNRPAEEQDVVYGQEAGKPLLLDIYRPTGPTRPRPGVILIHGGGWVHGDKSVNQELARDLTREGYVTISVGYRLAMDDASRHPAQVNDVRRAVRWVRAHAREIGVNPDRIGALGHSAGGHLAAILGTTEFLGIGDPSLKGFSSRVSCVVDWCGPTDFTDEASPPVGPKIADVIPNLFGKTRAEAPEAYRDASPVVHVDDRSAPTLIIHGIADDIVPIDQSRKLRDALIKAGVEVKLIELPGEGHIVSGQENSEVMLRETLAFLNRHLHP